jgi:hypothetical protein
LPPQRLGITHWLARFLAAELGISFATVARIWRKWDIQPHRLEEIKRALHEEKPKGLFRRRESGTGHQTPFAVKRSVLSVVICQVFDIASRNLDFCIPCKRVTRA